MREAYSRLAILLEERHLTVDKLQALLDLQDTSIANDSVAKEALMRLADPDRPLGNLNMVVVEAVCRELGIGIGDLLVFVEPLRLRRLPEITQQRLNTLIDHHTEEELQGDALHELETLVEEVDELSIFNAQLVFHHRQRLQVAPATRRSDAAD